MATTSDIELQRQPLGSGQDRPPATSSEEHEAFGYGDTSTKLWKLYGRESKKYDEALVDHWKSNTDSMLIFTGLFSTIVASFLIETYSGLTSGSGSQAASHSAVRVNILMVLSLFFSVTSALVSTLIQQWGREYLQYSQPSAAPHKRGRVRAYLHDGLSRFQMRRLTYGVPVLLHVSVFLFFYALSEWLYIVSAPVGATARYCLVVLLAVYMVLSVLPLIVRNSPYQTALTTPLQACVSLIQVAYLGLRQLVRLCFSRISTYEGQKRSGLFKSVRVDRARALMKEVKTRASELDRTAMHWLLQELNEDDMDTFLSSLPGYIHSPLTDKKVAVEGLLKDGIPERIREHITTCLSPVGLSQEESMSRASACITSLRLISETASTTSETVSITTVRRPVSENDDIQAIMEYLEPLCSNSSTALRASCIRGLVIREFLIPFAKLDAEELRTKKFPNHLKPLYRAIRLWKTTEISQWSHLTSNATTTSHPLPSSPSDQEMWADVVYDGPLINLAVLAYAVLSRASEEDVNLDMAWKTIETLLKSLSLNQVQVTAPARAQFDEVLIKARASGNSGYVGTLGGTQITPLLKTLATVISGLRLAEVFAYTPKPILPPRQIEAIFGPEQLRNSELFEAFTAHLPEFVRASTPEVSKSVMKHLILEDKLWEQLHFCLLRCLDPQVPFPDKLRIIMAFFDVFDVAFEVLELSGVDWRSRDLDLLFGHFWVFQTRVAPGKIVSKVDSFRSVLFHGQFCHALLCQFSLQRSRGEPLLMEFFNSIIKLVELLGLGTPEERAYLMPAMPGHPSDARTGLDVMIRAEGILSVTLRDGPLSNFCILGRLAFDVMAGEGREASDLTSDDIKKLWKALGRALDTLHLPLVNASREIWVKFDYLRDVVRDPALLGGNSQTVEKLGPLLDMIERVERMRPRADSRAEGTGNADNQTRTDGPADREIGHPREPPIPGSSRQVETSQLERGPMDPRPYPPVLGTLPLGGMYQSASNSRTIPRQSSLDSVVLDESAFSSIPTTQPGLGVDIRDPSAYLPHVPQVHPFSFVPHPIPGPGAAIRVPSAYPPHVPQIHMSSFSPPLIPDRNGPRRNVTLGPANLRAQAHMQSRPTDIPVPPRHMVDPFAPRSWIPTRQSNLDQFESPASSVPTTQLGFGAGFPVPSAYPLHDASVLQEHPQRLAPAPAPQGFVLPHVPQGHPLNIASSHAPGMNVDPTDLQAEAHMQPVPMGIPALPWHMLSNSSPPSLSSGPINVLPIGDAEAAEQDNLSTR